MVGSLNVRSDSIFKFYQSFGNLMNVQYTIRCAKTLVKIVDSYPAISEVGALFWDSSIIRKLNSYYLEVGHCDVK